jgi:hypothetical protein
MWIEMVVEWSLGWKGFPMYRERGREGTEWGNLEGGTERDGEGNGASECVHHLALRSVFEDRTHTLQTPPIAGVYHLAPGRLYGRASGSDGARVG